MDHITEAMDMVNHLPQPAFCVREGIVVQVNHAAASHMIEPGTAVCDLMQTGREEYAAFTGGQLYLNLSVCEQSLGFSVTRKTGFDLFILEQDADNTELQAMALAARELRDPLSSVMITADRLFPVAGLSDDPMLSEQVARINRGLFQMLRVISNMSDASRYASDTGSRQEVRDIVGMLEEVFHKASNLVGHTGVTLEYSGYSEPVYTLMDAEKLERAVMNILSNAIKFSPRGSVIQAKLVRHNNKLYLSVQDEGTGIAEDLRGNIFSRYAREPGVEDGRFGIGLGMVLIRSAATVHGGTVLVDHPRNAGTRITLSLAIRPGSGNQVHSPRLAVDYAGERDHGLIELSDILPAGMYDPKKVN